MRLVVSTIAGGVIAGLLFLLMHGMIDQDEDIDARPDKESLPNFRYERRTERVNTIDREMPEEPEEPERPPTEPLNTMPQERPEPEIEVPNIDLENTFGGGPQIETGPLRTGRADGPAEPISMVQPQWPRQARTQGIEGWVRIQFTIRADGTVSNAHVVESQPGRLFDRSAIRAIERWRFRPRVVDGRAVERQAVQVMEFKLDNSTR